jgi:predicted regulator of Ras-like GTPase activity (Roadblock/LC7/MglB family)
MTRGTYATFAVENGREGRLSTAGHSSAMSLRGEVARSETDATYIPVPAPTDISERLKDALDALRKIEGFLSAAVTRRDGLVIYHTFATAREAAGLSAMAAAMAGAARATGAELGQGEPEYGIFHFEEGVLLIREAGPEAILACLMGRDANLGFALMKMARVSEDVRETLEEF